MAQHHPLSTATVSIFRSPIVAEKRRRRRVAMNNCSTRRRLKPSDAMEEKKARATIPLASAEEAVPVAVDGLLTDDLILEILSRLPARSVHRFKCVSPSWRDFISDPANRKKLPQTLAGFLYCTFYRKDPRFLHFHFANVVSVSAAPPVDPFLSFLPLDKYLYVIHLDTCNGLLLCLCYMASSSPSADENAPVEYRYIVCNPATQRWVDLPPNSEMQDGHRILARLAFDPAVSSYFHVLQFEETDQDECVTGVNIYSSQTRVWKHSQSRLVEKITLCGGLTGVFFHGMLHLLGVLKPMRIDDDAVLVAVDMDGQVWKTIRVPSGGLSFGRIGLSQGCLHYATTPLATVNKNNKKKKKKQSTPPIASVWCMEDYDSKQWVLKHSVSSDELQSITRAEYKVVAIHPDCDTIFLDTCDDDTLASYDMQRRKLHRILCLRRNRDPRFLPYVPLFSNSLAGADGVVLPT